MFPAFPVEEPEALRALQLLSGSHLAVTSQDPVPCQPSGGHRGLDGGGLGANTAFPPLPPTARACVSNSLLASGLQGMASLKEALYLEASDPRQG